MRAAISSVFIEASGQSGELLVVRKRMPSRRLVRRISQLSFRGFLFTPFHRRVDARQGAGHELFFAPEMLIRFKRLLTRLPAHVLDQFLFAPFSVACVLRNLFDIPKRVGHKPMPALMGM